MKTIFFILLVLLVRSEGKLHSQSEEEEGQEEEDSCAVIMEKEITTWPAYVKAYGRYYEGLEIGDKKRRKLFEDKYNHIKKWNEEFKKGLNDYSKGIYYFTAKTKDELPFLKKPIKIDWNFTGDPEPFDKDEEYSGKVDWRHEGIVSRIKNQKHCGACYAFGAIETLESQYAKKCGKLPRLSVQMLVDCSRNEGNQGCAGGFVANTFEFIKKEGVPEEKYYPYVAEDQSCRNIKKCRKRYKVKKYTELAPGDEGMLMRAVAKHGPVAVAIDGSNPAFMHYKGGIFHDPECKSDYLDHVVVVIGYGTEKGKDFWLIKNSWGEEWGEGGYIRLRRNKGNLCGVASRALYPTI